MTELFLHVYYMTYKGTPHIVSMVLNAWSQSVRHIASSEKMTFSEESIRSGTGRCCNLPINVCGSLNNTLITKKVLPSLGTTYYQQISILRSACSEPYQNKITFSDPKSH